MKLFFLSIFSLIVSLNSFADGPQTIPVNIPLTYAYIPMGHDSNDYVRFMVEGYLPNLCYEVGKVGVLQSGKDIFVSMQGKYHRDREDYCLQAIYYFQKEVKIPTYLTPGKYEVKLISDKMGEEHGMRLAHEISFVAPLSILPNRVKSVDDYLYANVQEIERTQDVHKVLLKGIHPEDCLKLKKIQIISNEKDTFSILPIMYQYKTICFEDAKQVPFEYEVTLPDTLKKERILLHVRTAIGGSINKLVPFLH